MPRPAKGQVTSLGMTEGGVSRACVPLGTDPGCPVGPLEGVGRAPDRLQVTMLGEANELVRQSQQPQL